MTLSYAVCNVTILPLRSAPSHRAEQVSQILYGERVEILELENGDWARVRCFWDEYEGWCKFSQLHIVTKKEFARQPKYLSSGHGNKLIFEHGEMHVPAGGDLYGLKAGNISIDGGRGKWKGKKITVKELEPNAERITAVAQSYLYAPYQWGGRSNAGIDCSGLSQMIYKQCGVKLLRDASQQVTQGETISFLQEARCGDLAFFHNDEGKINHVGVLLDNDTIIHATETSGYVVMDKIDQEGIVSRKLRKRTHTLRIIKRLW